MVWAAACRVTRYRAAQLPAQCSLGSVDPHTRHAQTARRASLSHSFGLHRRANRVQIFRRPALIEEGRFASRHERWVWDAMAGVSPRRVSARRLVTCRTTKSRGPGLPVLRLSLWALLMSGLRVMGARQPIPRESAYNS